MQEGNLNLSCKFFEIALKLYSLLEESLPILKAKKMCLVLIVFIACEELHSKFAAGEPREKGSIQSILEDIKKYYQITDNLVKKTEMIEDPTEYLQKIEEEITIPLMFVNEFRCLVWLNSSDSILEQKIQEASEYNCIKPQAFEVMASFALENGYSSRIVTKCLELTLSRLSRIPNQSQTNKFYYLLIFLSKKAETKEGALKYFEIALENLKKQNSLNFDSFQLQRAKWFAIEAWNNAVYYYKLIQYEKSERWVSVAISFCKFLPDNDGLKSEIFGMYSKIIERIEVSKRKGINNSNLI